MKDEVLERKKEARNFLHTIEGKKGNWIGHIVRSNIIELKIDRKIKGREDKEEEVSNCWMTDGRKTTMEFGRRSTRSSSLRN